MFSTFSITPVEDSQHNYKVDPTDLKKGLINRRIDKSQELPVKEYIVSNKCKLKPRE